MSQDNICKFNHSLTLMKWYFRTFVIAIISQSIIYTVKYERGVGNIIRAARKSKINLQLLLEIVQMRKALTVTSKAFLGKIQYTLDLLIELARTLIAILEFL